ncbi:MAG: heat shock protein transcriptional repressor HspR [Solirubrobacterales bacterium]
MAARRTTRTTRTTVTVESGRGVFMISVAAELAEMHPQTLRMYEQRGLISPKRSPKGTRLYSQEDVDRLRRIQEMTTELGLNLAGVERVLALEEQLAGAQRQLEELEGELEAARRTLRGDLVPVTRSTPARLRPSSVVISWMRRSRSTSSWE